MMKRMLQILVLVSGVVCAISACVLGGMYAASLIKRLKQTYETIYNCFRPIDYVVESDED